MFRRLRGRQATGPLGVAGGGHRLDCIHELYGFLGNTVVKTRERNRKAHARNKS